MQIKTANLTINYTVEGPAQAPVIVCSNSLATDLRMWQAQAENLRTDYRVVRYDTRGHGGTQVPAAPYTLDALVGDVTALLDALALSQVHFVGISLGGMTALGLALAQPRRLLSITVANAIARVPPAAHAMWDERVQIARSAGMQALVEPTIGRWFTPPTLAARAADIDQVRAMIAATPVEGYAGACAAIKQLDYLEHLASIELPALFIGGTHDAAATPATMRDMQARIAGAEWLELDAAHLSNIERPAAFNAGLREFLRRVDAR